MMKTLIPSYLSKEFIIDDNQAVIRNPNNLDQSSRFKDGDEIPPGFAIGNKKILPLQIKVKVTEVKMDGNRNVYVYAKPINASVFVPEGWTRASNLLDKFVNEIVDYVPNDWDLIPMGDNFTVIDDNALIRTGPPEFKPKSKTISRGTYVDVTARSRQTDPEGKFMRVCFATINDDELVRGEPIGWTSSTNLVEGNSKVFTSSGWLEIKGRNAVWAGGKFKGFKVLISIVGSGAQIQYITLDMLAPYLKLCEAAKKGNVLLSINSGFRTFAKQKELFDLYKSGRGNLAARPGASNHQDGIAIDLNTHGFEGSSTYDWLKKNATAFGFIRTVNKEHWHWEYQPKTAAKFRKKGLFKLPRVRK